MKAYLVLLLFVVVGTTKARNYVKGEIKEDDTTWFLSNLSVVPAMTASLEYNIQFPTGGQRPIFTFYYKGQNSSNLYDKCNNEMHGQLCNKNLADANIYSDCYRVGCTGTRGCFFGICPATCTHWNCYGRTKIQDFEPKSYFFSLGFECKENRNLNGVKYEVTIFDESNETSCVLNNVEPQRIDRCDRSYQYAAIPNQVGDTDLDDAVSNMNKFMDDVELGKGLKWTWKRWFTYIPKRCLKKVKPFLCEIFLPQCLPEENKILLPCRDTCKSLMENCGSLVQFFSDFLGIDVNCDYLPPCPPNYLIIGLGVGACVIVIVILVVMVTVCCVKCRKRVYAPPGTQTVPVT